jgi:hypothetical protein
MQTIPSSLANAHMPPPLPLLLMDPMPLWFTPEQLAVSALDDNDSFEDDEFEDEFDDEDEDLFDDEDDESVLDMEDEPAYHDEDPLFSMDED